MGRPGRPKKETCKDNRFEVRLSDEDLEVMDEICDRTGKNRSDVMRTALLVYQNLIEQPY